jgi:RNA polymerase sigma factor (sigma-70 family)
MREAGSITPGSASIVHSHDFAVEQIFREYGRLIRHAIRQAGGAEGSLLADDIEQTVVVSLWRQVARSQKIAHPAAYIYRTTIRETIRAVRRERDRAAAAVHAPTPATARIDPEAMAVARQRRRTVAMALAKLPPDRARAVRARLTGASVPEIMRMTGWTYQRTRNLVARGMSDLRAALED